MEILDIGDGNHRALTNLEAMAVLKQREEQRAQEVASGRRQKKKKNQSVLVEEALLEYLKSTPAATQEESHIKQFLKRVSPFKMTKQEVLYVINERPSTLVQLILLLPECTARLGNERMEKILDIVNSTFRSAPKDEFDDVDKMEEEEKEEEEGEEEEEEGEEEGEELIPEQLGQNDMDNDHDDDE